MGALRLTSTRCCFRLYTTAFRPQLCVVVLLVFDGFELDREGCRLFREGVEVPIERRVFDLLCYLVAHPKRLIGRAELLEHVWRTRALSDGVLANTMTKLRRAIGQPTDGREPIETVRGRGYRFHGLARETPVPELGVAHPAPAPDSGGDPFVGRQRALERLSAALGQVARGGGRLLVVAGEAGIGKTRLLLELEQLALARGFSAWLGAAHDGGVAPAYWPWVEILRSAHEQLSPEAWQRMLPDSYLALAQLVPELCSQPVSTSGDPQTQRFKLFDELTQFLVAASREAPRLLAIDDLHWADAGTVELLAYAARVLERCPVLLVATLRDHGAVLDAQHAAALRRLERKATRIPLRGLSKDEVAELTFALEQSARGDTRLAEALCERTGGNPLFVRQLLGWLKQRGALSDQGVRQLSIADLPPALRDVVMQRIAALGDDTRSVLSVAAVAGHEFEVSLIAAALGRSLEQVLSAIEPALQLGVVEHHSTLLPQRFAFLHSMLRDVLYESLGAVQRGQLHAKLAHALLARGAASDPSRSGEIARHLLLAVPSDLEACVTHCRAAARAARVSTGFEAAAELLSRLIQKHESEGGDPHVRCELLRELAADQGAVGAVSAAWDTLRRGAELARQLKAAPLLARFAHHLTPWVELGGGDEAYVHALLEQALRSVGQDDSDLRAALLARRAALEYERPLSERNAWFDEAEALAARCAAPNVLLEVAGARAVMRGPIPLPGQRAAVRRFRLLDAEHRGAYASPVRLAQSFQVEWVEYRNALTMCDLDGVDAALARCRAIARGANMMMLDFLVALMDAGRALGDGRLTELEAVVQRLREASGVGGSSGIAWMGYAVLLAYERGTLASGVDAPNIEHEVRSRFPEGQRVNASVALAWFTAQAGDLGGAARMLASEPRAALSRAPRQRGDLSTLCQLAEAYFLIGDREGGAQLLPLLQPFAELNAVGNSCEYRGAVAHYLGLLSALLGRPAEAAAHFERAEALNTRLQMPLQLARTQAQRARVELR
jgi:DNA-binding winged helix-turn-helix (wHTH) protein/tetratricopeptide (TPR) repeat protein